MKHVLKVDNIYSYFLSGDLELKQKLFEVFRHREEGYVFTPAYKQRRWDGYVNFFSKDTGRIMTGLLPELEYALKYKFKVDYEKQDSRQQYEFLHKDIEAGFLNRWIDDEEDHISLYDYQIDLIQAAIKHKRGLIKAPTGAGKTNIMIGIARALPPNTPILFMTKGKSLVQQNYENFLNAGFKNVGRIYTGHKEPNVITCTTVESAYKLEKLFKHIKCLIVDEVHMCMSDVPIRIYRKLKWTPIRLGISATPFKQDGKIKSNKYKTKGFFGPIFLTRATDTGKMGELTTKELQNRGILSGANCIFYELDEPQLPYAVYQDAVKYGIAENPAMHSAVKKIVQKQCKGRTLILVERLVQGDQLAAMIPGAYWIQGKDDEEIRTAVIEKLKKSENVIAIVSQKIISAGIDVKIHNLVNAAGGKASHSIIQRFGRGLRTADDKDDLTYYDFLNNTNDYLRDHSEERIKTLKKEGHNVCVEELNL